MVTIERGMDDHTIYLTVQVPMASDNDYIPATCEYYAYTSLGSLALSASALRAYRSAIHSTYTAIHIHLEGYQLLGSAIQA